MAKKRRITFRSDCCNEPIIYDATAIWCEEAQEMEHSDTQDWCACQECGEECREKVFDLDTGEELEASPVWQEGYIPVAEAEAKHEAQREKWRLEREAEVANQKATSTAIANAEALASAYV